MGGRSLSLSREAARLEIARRERLFHQFDPFRETIDVLLLDLAMRQSGGNGHWYALNQSELTWDSAQAAAQQLGGHLATLTTPQENAFLLTFAQSLPQLWIGGFQDRTWPGYSEPGGGWRWVTGEPWSMTLWGINQPDNSGANENKIEFATIFAGFWNDLDGSVPKGSIIEWSADCNEDGFVDYGPLQSGQLPDANGNHIPDCCESLCCTADLFPDGVVNGADLGIPLSQWGPATPSTVGDIDHNGVVDAADLSVLLAGWGPC